MSKHYALTAAKRDQAGKGAARSIRRENRIPAVIYGDKKEPVLISLPAKEVNIEYNKGHMYTNLCDMDVDGQKHLVLVRDVQLHPVKDVVEHVDFMRVTAKTRIAVYVPVRFINEDKSPSIYNKGTLNIVRHEVELLCGATSIPEFIEVDIEGKAHGDAVKISNAVLPKGITPVITNRDFTIATLVAPKTAAQAEAEDAAEAPVAAPEAAEEKEEDNKDEAKK
ncbi:MAG: 50S ribosomal protein L25/general stress protein Ctc [Alphaproteobacteria bacterium]|nr:50S ribosomal protein L25/general stress protein Ctc [Alphaproteobacteria bacterium]